MNRIAFSVVLVGLGIATGLLASPGLAEPNAAIRGPNARSVTALREERRDILRQTVEQAEVLYRNAKIDEASMRRITINLLNAELDLAPELAGRIALRKRTVEQFKAIEEVVVARVESARATNTDLLEAKAARLQAEIDLLLETANGK
jgi:outer membrane protein TolC